MKFAYLNEHVGVINKKEIDDHANYDVRAIVQAMIEVKSVRDFILLLETIPCSFFAKMFFSFDEKGEMILDYLPDKDRHTYKWDIERALQKEWLDIDYLDEFLIREGVLGPLIDNTRTSDLKDKKVRRVEHFKPVGQYEFIYMESIESIMNNVQQLCLFGAIASARTQLNDVIVREPLWGNDGAQIIKSGLSVESSFNSDHMARAALPMLFSDKEIKALESNLGQSGFTVKYGNLHYNGDLDNKAFLVREEMSDSEIAAFIFTWFMNSLFEGGSDTYYSGNTFKVSFNNGKFEVLHQRSPFRDLYYQVAKLAEAGQIKVCAHCGRAFIDAKSRGNEALYCSRSCNTKASNRRRELALQYKAAGIPVEKAIEEIGQKYAKSIRGWFELEQFDENLSNDLDVGING